MSQALLVSGDWTVSSNIIVDDVMRERERERSTCERLSRERERETRERERERERAPCCTLATVNIVWHFVTFLCCNFGSLTGTVLAVVHLVVHICTHQSADIFPPFWSCCTLTV